MKTLIYTHCKSLPISQWKLLGQSTGQALLYPPSVLTICWKFPNPSFSFVPRLNPRVRCFLHSGMRECIPVGTCSRLQLLFFGPVTHLRYAIQQSASRIIYTLTDRLNVWMNTKTLNVGHRGLSVIHYCPYLVIHFSWEMSDTRYAQASHISSSSVHSASQRVFSPRWENKCVWCFLS